jgi:hypothetical protein
VLETLKGSGNLQQTLLFLPVALKAFSTARLAGRWPKEPWFWIIMRPISRTDRLSASL